jgi:16S rRNA (cytosine967-C5)-methyltransferase
VKNLSSGVKSRLLAFDLLDAVNREGAYANLALPKILGDSNLSVQDKAFVTELGYGTLRMQGKYDFAISQFADRPVSDIDGKLLDLLRLGAHQIFSMRTPAHAAINETVEVGKKVVGKSRSSFLNAMLRKLAGIPDIDVLIDEKLTDPIEKLTVKYSHPTWIIRAFFDRLGDWEEVEKLLVADNTAAKPNLIAWPGLSTTDELLLSGGNKIDFLDNGVITESPPESIPAIRERRAGVQDAGSQYLTDLVLATNDSSDLEWLDLCAAPGGKAKYIYEYLRHKHFTANEINSSRFGLLKQILPANVLLNLDGREAREFPKKYDRILIDAPCTGLGALRRRPEARWRKSMADLKELIKIQRELIDSAMNLLNPGGIIAYATCSPHLLETKVQVADALHRHKNLEILSLKTLNIKYSKGIEEDGTMQLWTHRDQTDSMFLALLRLNK